VRVALLIGVLAIVFAPGAVGSSTGRDHDRALAAAMLAPTTTEQATVRTVESRVDSMLRLRNAATLWVLVALAAVACIGWRIDDRPNDRTDPLEVRRPPRRGPPLRTV
jgi:hypothetical protein